MPIGHIGINVVDFAKSREFYLAALKPLGYKQQITLQGGIVQGFGTLTGGPDFWISGLDAPIVDSDKKHGPESRLPPTTLEVVREKTGAMHIAFGASNRKKVREFYAAAIAAGGKCNGPPGVRSEYFATYYGAFVLDPEGRNIEAVCMKPGFWAEPWGFVGWGVATAVVAGAGSGFATWMGWL